MAAITRSNTASLELLTIYEVSKVLNSSLDLPRALREVLRLLAYQLQMERANICLLRQDKSLHLVAGVQLLQAEGGRSLNQVCHAVASRIIKAEIPVVVPNLEEEPLFDQEIGGKPGYTGNIASIIGVPIKAATRIVGVLMVERLKDEVSDRHFSADVRVLTMVANLIGQTVQLHRAVVEESRVLVQERLRIDRPLPEDHKISGVVCASPAMKDVLAQVHRVAPFKSTVLIRGESGTGKELIARAIHDLSLRAQGPFVRVNCAALSETLLESELFGHDRGAFTGANRDHKGRFELASGGTLFLDEIGDISPSFQAKLLRVLQEQEFERVGGTRTLKTDVRLIAATNVNLEEAVGLGTFRADLYFRINVVAVFLPPLRDRREDIRVLAQHFVDSFNRQNGLDVRLADDAFDVLGNCPWPGNVRELENCIERAATQCRDQTIRGNDLACQTGQCNTSTLMSYRPLPSSGRGSGNVEPAAMTDRAGDRPTCSAGWPDGCSAGAASGCAAASPLEASEPGAYRPSPAASSPAGAEDDTATTRERLVWAMDRSGWVQAKAARLLGLSARQLSYALRKHKIEIKRM